MPSDLSCALESAPLLWHYFRQIWACLGRGKRPSVVPGDSPMCILIVDDEPLVCDSVAEFLRSEGFLVVKTYDAHHALELANQLSREIRAVITDLKMPKMSGIEMWLQMKDIIRPDCRVLFMSGNAEEHLVGGVQLPGELLPKPFSFGSLKEKLSGLDPESD